MAGFQQLAVRTLRISRTSARRVDLAQFEPSGPALDGGRRAREADASNIWGMAQAIGAYQTRELCIRRSPPAARICGRNGELFFMDGRIPSGPTVTARVRRPGSHGAAGRVNSS